ncbi:MAG TPA: hypothetical protein VJ953_10445 [Saprospiraceae bacterium]|nr:hypothetical protein [Saprospiraceae bacterium]
MITKHLPDIHPRSGAPEAHGHFMSVVFSLNNSILKTRCKIEGCTPIYPLGGVVDICDIRGAKPIFY